MATESIYEIGDNLEALALKARQWFNDNNVEVPSGARVWQRCSVRKGEIPPGTGVTSLRRYGFNVTAFISAITNNPNLKPYKYNPITQDNIVSLGFNLLKTRVINGHKKLTVSCLKCTREEELDYGTLQRMKDAGNTFCRYCREAGGKQKTLDSYKEFEGFTLLSRTENKRFNYKCNTCNSNIVRTMTHTHTAEYIVCEVCNPRENFGARLYTELGYFDSKIEFEAYKILLKYFNKDEIVRQKKYNELFSTGTKHTADFYIPKIPLVLEVTSKYNKIGTKYKETALWKQSLSNIVIFAYSLSEVEDIVRPLLKISGLSVDHSGSLLCSCPVWRLRTSVSI
jgi:hypothetical protein